MPPPETETAPAPPAATAAGGTSQGQSAVGRSEAHRSPKGKQSKTHLKAITHQVGFPSIGLVGAALLVKDTCVQERPFANTIYIKRVVTLSSFAKDARAPCVCPLTSKAQGLNSGSSCPREVLAPSRLPLLRPPMAWSTRTSLSYLQVHHRNLRRATWRPSKPHLILLSCRQTLLKSPLRVSSQQERRIHRKVRFHVQTIASACDHVRRFPVAFHQDLVGLANLLCAPPNAPKLCSCPSLWCPFTSTCTLVQHTCAVFVKDDQDSSTPMCVLQGGAPTFCDHLCQYTCAVLVKHN